MAPLVLKMLKRFVNDGVLPKGPSQHFGAVKSEIELIAQSEDVKEGFEALRHKRAPRFVGR
jgi:enoyl-CoA hydratase/carnithine racemase